MVRARVFWLLLGIVAAPSLGWSWQFYAKGDSNLSDDSPTSLLDLAVAVVFDPSGDVVVAGELHNATTGSDVAVLKLSGRDGHELWRAVIDGGRHDRADALALDAAGNAVVSGSLDEQTFMVAKLAASDGSTIWNRSVAPGRFTTVRVDAAGDVIAAGEFLDVADHGVVKLDGTDGTDVWRKNGYRAPIAVTAGGDVIATTFETADCVTVTGNGGVVRLAAVDGSEVWNVPLPCFAVESVAVDGAGAVVAAGTADGPTLHEGSDFVVAKFAGNDGAELWRTHVNGAEPVNVEAAHVVTVDQAGDVVAGGKISSSQCDAFGVAKFGGADGAELWRRVILPVCGEAVDVAADGAGDVVAVGRINGSFDAGRGYGPNDFAVFKLAGSSGTTLWKHTLDGNGELPGDGRNNDQAFAVALDATGNVAAAGTIYRETTFSDLAVLRFDGTIGFYGLERDTERCQEAIAKAGQLYLKRRLQALQRCRNAIQDGTLAIPPASCPTEPGTSTKIAAAGRSARAALTNRCTDLLVAKLQACAATVDGLVGPAGDTGCVITTDTATADALLASEYSDGPVPSDAGTLGCQIAIARSAGIDAAAVIKAAERCRDLLRKQAPGFLLSDDECLSASATAKTIGRAGLRLRSGVATACTDAEVASLGPCAASVDGLVAPAGDSGCLVAAALQAVDSAATAAYGR